MNWNLPIDVTIDSTVYHIAKKCDYRVVLDVIDILNDDDFAENDRVICALLCFYDDLTRDNIKNCPHLSELAQEMLKIINYGEEETTQASASPALMDWSHDFNVIAPAVNRVLGYDIRTPDKYSHWYTVLGGYMEIGECQFSTIVSIRSKRSKGKKLDKWELDYVREHRNKVELPKKLTKEERELLDSPW